MSKKEKMMTYFEVYHKEFSMFYIIIETRGNKYNELIVNPIGNYEKKIEYINKAYNDDLVLNTYDGIKIVGYDVCDSFETIQGMYEECEECCGE